MPCLCYMNSNHYDLIILSKTVLLFSHLPSWNKNIFGTLNVKDFVCKSYTCAETSILARLAGMMQLNGEKSSWKNGIPHL